MTADSAEVKSLGRKLDWKEVCYGMLFSPFLYIVHYHDQYIDLLFGLIVMTKEEVEMCI